MLRTAYLIKPSRLTDEQPELDTAYVLENFRRGVETSVILDLNILNLFKLAQTPDSGVLLDGDEIEGVTKVINTPLLFLTPGLALGEADERYLDDLHVSFEDFLAKHCRGYVDAPNATFNLKDRVRSRKFESLPGTEKMFYSVAYLALLKIHLILLSEPKLSGEAKFDLFLEYMDGVANFVPAIEADVAKFCFFDRNQLSRDDQQFSLTCKSISENFNKGIRGKGRLEKVLNAARDIMYLRSAAMQDGKSFDGKIQDTWVLTCDQGMVNLSNSIYFFPKDGERAKYATLAGVPARRRLSYWRYVDKYFDQMVSERSVNGSSNSKFHASEKHLQKLVEQARLLEDKLNKLVK